MSNWFKDNSLSIGRTPLVRLNRIVDGARATVLGKIEGRNRSYSVKCRIGASMVWDADRRGLLGPGKELVEPTSGNTGIALAFVAAARGIPLTLTMPETLSVERRKLLIAFGVKLVLTEGPKGMSGAVAKSEEIVASDPDRYVLLQQFKNPANPAIHEQRTGPEIWHDTDGAIDIFVSGIGTGGTITGVSRYIKQTQRRPLVSVAVEPSASPVLTQHRAKQPLKPAPHKIQSLAGRRVRASYQRGGDRIRPSADARGRDPVRHFERRCRCIGFAHCQASGQCGQGHYCHPLGFRRAVPQHSSVRKDI